MQRTAVAMGPLRRFSIDRVVLVSMALATVTPRAARAQEGSAHGAESVATPAAVATSPVSPSAGEAVAGGSRPVPWRWTLTDGRTIVGVATAEDDATVTIETVPESIRIEADDIDGVRWERIQGDPIEGLPIAADPAGVTLRTSTGPHRLGHAEIRRIEVRLRDRRTFAGELAALPLGAIVLRLPSRTERVSRGEIATRATATGADPVRGLPERTVRGHWRFENRGGRVVLGVTIVRNSTALTVQDARTCESVVLPWSDLKSMRRVVGEGPIAERRCAEPDVRWIARTLPQSGIDPERTLQVSSAPAPLGRIGRDVLIGTSAVNLVFAGFACRPEQWQPCLAPLPIVGPLAAALLLQLDPMSNLETRTTSMIVLLFDAAVQAAAAALFFRGGGLQDLFGRHRPERPVRPVRLGLAPVGAGGHAGVLVYGAF